MNIRADHTYPEHGFSVLEGSPGKFYLNHDGEMLMSEVLHVATSFGYQFEAEADGELLCTNIPEMNSYIEVRLPHIPERKSFLITVEVNRYTMPSADIKAAVIDALRCGCIKTLLIESPSTLDMQYIEHKLEEEKT